MQKKIRSNDTTILVHRSESLTTVFILPRTWRSGSGRGSSRHRLMSDWLIEIVGVADYLAIVGMARDGAKAVILRHIVQIVLPVVSLDNRSLPIDKTLTSGSVRLRSQDLTVILCAYSDIGTFAVNLI